MIRDVINAEKKQFRVIKKMWGNKKEKERRNKRKKERKKIVNGKMDSFEGIKLND